VGGREHVKGAGVFMVNMVPMKAIEPWKDCATKAMSDMSTIRDLGVGEASTSRRVRLVLPLEAKLLQIVLREVGVIDDHDEALRVELVTTPHEFYPGLQLLRVVHTYDHVGAVVGNFVIETDRTLDLVDAFALNYVTRVKVDVLESRSNVVFGAAALRANLVLGIVHRVATNQTNGKPALQVGWLLR
jgi:hypothetical protein